MIMCLSLEAYQVRLLRFFMACPWKPWQFAASGRLCCPQEAYAAHERPMCASGPEHICCSMFYVPCYSFYGSFYIPRILVLLHSVCPFYTQASIYCSCRVYILPRLRQCSDFSPRALLCCPWAARPRRLAGDPSQYL